MTGTTKRAVRPARPAVLVTGATGFIGSALCPLLEESGWRVIRALRRPGAKPRPGDALVGHINGRTRWPPWLGEVQAVVHLASVVHLPGADAELYQEVNAAGSARLARQAAAAGVGRFIYVSTVKVMGERSAAHPFTPHDRPRPRGPYAVSKLLAEEEVLAAAREQGMEAVILRPPLVHGPGAGGNFARLVRLVRRQAPLPLGRVRNLRSLAGRDNLCACILRLLAHGGVPEHPLFLRDDPDISTPDLVRLLARLCGVRPRLLPVPPVLLRAAASLLGRGEDMDRLTASLQVDDSATREFLGWNPPLGLEQGLARAVRT